MPKSVRSVVIHCGTNNIGTSSSDEINLGVITIGKSISHCYPNIEDFVSGLLPTEIHWSALKVKRRPMLISENIVKNPIKLL